MGAGWTRPRWSWCICGPARSTGAAPASTPAPGPPCPPPKREGEFAGEVERLPPDRPAPADLDELLARRATLISAVRAAYPGLAQTLLTRLDDGSYQDAWRWDSAEQMKAAGP